ncbi:MAG: HAD hydrolase family protein [Marinifilaceae bacterium]|jgi:3-deoxy-D-manno-octulosonate 8-phosphate phosphatase (KDO 8-P phosphatase)|nr:HAD hydrolase family protein [Marinifilaceae bacterium]
MAFFKEELNKIKAFVFDVDGVLSIPEIQINENGQLIRTANTKDGYAIQYAIKQGYKIAIITGGICERVRKRYEYLGVQDIVLGSKDKIADLNSFAEKYDLDIDSIVYMGDDMPDYEVMQKVGLATCPLDAIPAIKEISDYVSDYKGGMGCVRDLVEQVLRTQKKWVIDTSVRSI